MHVTIPKIPKLPSKYQKRIKHIKKRVVAFKKSYTRNTSFIGRYWKMVTNQFRRFGRKVHDISPQWLRRAASFVARPFKYFYRRSRLLLRRRPHRSFHMTRRRDYVRSLKLPGYWQFTSDVIKLLWSHKKLFGLLVLIYTILYSAVAGVGAQDAYSNLTTALKQTGSDVFSGAWGGVGQAGLLLVTTFTTGLTPNPTGAQSTLVIIIIFMTWLTSIWLLRNLMAGHNVRLRDGIYSSGSPIISTLIVGMILAIQSLPLAVLILIYNAATFSGLIDGGVEAMLFWIVAILIIVLVLYWMTSTIIGLVVVTLPGMYPFQAIKTAGDLVIGRRVRVLLRLVWMVVWTIVVWLVVAIPIIMFDSWLKTVLPAIQWLPLVPIVVLFMAALSLVWMSTYTYILYRKVVEDDATPA